MTSYYFDTSAVVKRYFPESGTGWVTTTTDPATQHVILVSELALAETAAAIAAKQRASGGMSIAERDRILQLFLLHCHREYTLIPSQRPVIDRAVLLTQQYRLRGYDAVQLATALLVQVQYQAAGFAPLTVVSADTDLIAAAQAEGLGVINPNQYP